MIPARRSVATALVWATALATTAGPAHADPLSPIRDHEVTLHAHGHSWYVEGIGPGSGDAVLLLPSGPRRIRVGGVAMKLDVDGPLRLEHRKASPEWRTAGAVALGLGGLAAAGGLLAASGLCTRSEYTDFAGRTVYRPCPRWDDATTRAFVFVAGGGLTVALAGAIAYFTSGESLRVEEPSPRSAAHGKHARVARVQWSPIVSTRGGGAALLVRF